MLKILSWNIRQGGGSRVQSILRFISLQNVSILVLSEFRNNEKGAQLRYGLLQMQYHFQATADTPADENCVLIASKLPFNSRLFNDKGLDYSYGMLAADFPSFHLYGVYLPHKKKHLLFNKLNTEIQKYRPGIITGDFNSGINGVDQKGNSFWYEKDLKLLNRQNMIDAFRYINGDKREYSWYSYQGNGYRYDHTYVHQDLLTVIKKCEYIHEARNNKLSDHSPMLLELG